MKKFIVVIIFFFVIFSFVGKSFSFFFCEKIIGTHHSLIVDTDVNVDDLVAILFLLKCKNIDLKAITTVGCSITHHKIGARNVSNLLYFAGHPNIPVAIGEGKSLSPYGSFPKEWKKFVNDLPGIYLPKNPYPLSKLSSVDLLIKKLSESKKKISILVTGPMTNIAVALKKEPLIKKKIKRLYIMAGAIDVPGNIYGKIKNIENKVAEYNILLDAKAADIIFCSKIPITLIPLDATNQVPFSKNFASRFKKERKTSYSQFSYQILKKASTEAAKKLYLWDILAAILVTKHNIGKYENLKLQVNLEEGKEYGKLIQSEKGNLIKVCKKIDKKSFYDILIHTLNSSYSRAY